MKKFFYCFAKVTFNFRSPPNFVLCKASRATPEETSSANSTNAIFLRPGIVRTSVRFGYLLVFFNVSDMTSEGFHRRFRGADEVSQSRGGREKTTKLKGKKGTDRN